MPALRGRSIFSGACKQGQGAVITDISSADKMSSDLWLRGNYVTRAAAFPPCHPSQSGKKADAFDNILTQPLREGGVR